LVSVDFDFKVIESSEHRLTVELDGVRKELVNALRRTMMAEVPTIAIDEVLFTENTSSVYNEYIAHRLGLLPLRTPGTPEELARISIDLQSGVVPPIRVDYQLRAECPIQTAGSITVNSGDLRTLTEETEVQPVYTRVPLFKLGHGQVVEFQAFARYGIGKQHVKFSPVSPVSYSFKPVLVFDKSKDFNCEEHVSVCPTNCIEYKGGQLVFTDAWKCILCKACEKDCKTGATKIIWDESVTRLTIESTGSLSPSVILKTAVLILIRKLQLAGEQLNRQVAVEESKQ
jgi:DNA-directed RNA polymerase subunit D